MDRCNDLKKPDPAAREELRNMLADSQHAREIMGEQGLFAQALNRRIESFAQSNDLYREVTLFNAEQLRTSLGYDSASVLERLAIEQIVLTWVNLLQVDALHTAALSKSPTMQQGIYWDKRLSFATTRYSKALETLARIRRLNLTVQVNVAHNQVVRNG